MSLERDNIPYVDCINHNFATYSMGILRLILIILFQSEFPKIMKRLYQNQESDDCSNDICREVVISPTIEIKDRTGIINREHYIIQSLPLKIKNLFSAYRK